MHQQNGKGVGALATRIRLKRMGAKKQPYFRLVVAEQRTPRDGRTIEDLGVYSPIFDPPLLQINAERALHWLMQGAQPTETARSLLSRAGVLAAFAEAKRAKKAEASNAEPQEA